VARIYSLSSVFPQRPFSRRLLQTTRDAGFLRGTYTLFTSPFPHLGSNHWKAIYFKFGNEETKMKNYSLLAVALLVCAGAAEMKRTSMMTIDKNVSTNPQVGSAAFRDGLYLGKLDSEHGNTPHVAVGRWSRANDRVSFAEGYNQAYGDGFSGDAAQRNLMHQASLVR
jgi:hypothetical protein